METAAVIRRRCPHCAWWDNFKRQRHFSMAKMTDWRPPDGTDPKMREFKCSDCGYVFYQVRRDCE
jgi:ribosomal protein L32E